MSETPTNTDEKIFVTNDDLGEDDVLKVDLDDQADHEDLKVEVSDKPKEVRVPRDRMQTLFN